MTTKIRTLIVDDEPMARERVLSLLADHPALQATAETLGVFSLLTDGRLRDMYSAARTGRRLVELAPVCLPPASAEHVLSAKYAGHTEPHRQLEQMVEGLRRRNQILRDRALRAKLVEAQRRGDSALVAQLINESRK